jgi:hypothetical protein
VLDIGSSNYNGHNSTPSSLTSVHTHNWSGNACLSLPEKFMQGAEEQDIENVIKEIGTLLATAYRRRAKLPLLPKNLASSAAIEALENQGQTSVHGLRLTCQREEPK